MSQSDSDSVQALISQFEINFAFNCIIYSTSALILYDHLLTLDGDWAAFSKRQRSWTASTILLVANRLSTWSFALSLIIPYTFRTCNSKFVLWLNTLIGVFPFCVISAFSGLRVYALTERNYPITVAVVVLSLVPLITNIYVTAVQLQVLFVEQPTIGSFCAYANSFSVTTQLILSLTTRVSAVVSDFIVVVVTWYRTFRHSREAARVGMEVGISATLLRDGSIYFLVLLILNSAQLVNEAVPQWNSFNLIAEINQPITFIVTSRFLLNLRTVTDPSETSMDDMKGSTSLNFRIPNIGDMGESLDYGSCRYVDDVWTNGAEHGTDTADADKDVRIPSPASRMVLEEEAIRGERRSICDAQVEQAD